MSAWMDGWNEVSKHDGVTDNNKLYSPKSVAHTYTITKNS